MLKKINRVGIPLEQYVKGKICWGIKTGLNEAFVINQKIKEELIAKNPKNLEIIKPFLTGRDIGRYSINSKQIYLIFTYHGVDIEKYPEIKEYLKPFKEKLENRATRQKWYELQQPQFAFKNYFESPKIIIPSIVKSASSTFDDTNFFTNNKTSIISSGDFYLLGILNSKISDFVIHSISSTKQGGYYEYHIMYISKIPIRTINPNDPSDISRHDRMVALVTQMLDLNKKLQEARLEQDKTMLSRQIEATDNQINTLVYEMYGLTVEEIMIVEGK